ncbi:hypothetical protein CH289_07625 [Rhodococcus sp. RS1C4]|nr:hypothetical protein [Rhodococcus sp. RS1C4]OZC55055.1 hypothetical protein CH289_07625 [Rhodococcus sp. RS1C4]
MVALLRKLEAPLDFRIHDNTYGTAEPLGKYVESELTWKKTGVDTGKLVVEGNHRHANNLRACVETVVPVTCSVNGKRWSGRAVDYRFHGPDNAYLEVDLKGEQRMLHGLLSYPNTFLPEWLQAPPQDIQIGGAKGVMMHYVGQNAARAGAPVVTAPHNRLDFSNFTVMAARMDPIDELFSQVLNQAAFQAKMDLWLPGDAQPFPSNRTMIRPSYIFDVVDPRDMRQEIQWSVEGGGITGFVETGKHPEGHTILVGGKSPDIINTLIRESVNALISLALSAIGLPFLSIGIGGLLDNILFAFNRFVDYTRKAQLGPYAWPEVWANAGAGAFTLDALQAGMQAMKDAAGQRAVKFTIGENKPYEFGKGFSDNGRPRYDVNDLVRFRNSGKIIEDYIAEVKMRDNRSGLREFDTIIGDDRTAQDPLAQLIGGIKGLATVVRSMNLQI